MVGVRAVPHLVVRVEEALHVPGARGVVHVVGVGVGAEGIARVERGSVLHREVQMVGFDEFGKVFGTHVRFLVTQSVLKVEFVDTELVRHGHVGLVRHALGNPVMAAHSFQPPDFVGVGEGDAIHLVGAEFLKQRAEALDALACGLDIRQHDGQEVLFADAAGHLGLIALGRRVFHERVGAEHALVGGQGFGGAHRHVRLVDAGLAPNTFLEVRVRHGGVLQRVVRQGDGQVGDHRLVFARLFLRLHDDEALRVELAVRGILVAGDDGRAVIARVFAYQNRGAGHSVMVSFLCCSHAPTGGSWTTKSD